MGTRAVYDALRGHHDITSEATPRLITANTIEPKLLAALRNNFV